jgi:hypothetical protein
MVGSGRVQILRYNPGIRLQGLSKTTKTSIRVADRRGKGLNPGTLTQPGIEPWSYSLLSENILTELSQLRYKIYKNKSVALQL